MFRFEQLKVYQKAVEFADFVYRETSKWSKEFTYNLVDQIRRAALSVSLNIAEGSGQTKRGFRRYLDIARGSCYECVPLIDMAFRRGLISTKEKIKWYNSVVELAKMISGLKSSLAK